MTHPDILTVERFGRLNPKYFAEKHEICINCGRQVCEDKVLSKDGAFCNMECLYEYYEIEFI